MESVILVTLNAKYVHSSLALQYLQAVLVKAGLAVELLEFTINGQLLEMVKTILSRKPRLVAFGCYIWNIEQTLELAAMLKQLDPQIKILVGGPEVSYERINEPFIDCVITGEAEQVIVDTVTKLLAGASPEVVTGCAVQDLDTIPSPITPYIKSLANRTAYYESSRGCPFNCQYCLSSTSDGVRFLSLHRVFKDLQLFLDAKVKQVKFVDRTFNVDKGRAQAIWQYLIEHDNGQTNFHFEIAAHLLDEASLEVLAQARSGLFQFEIGVQSTNPQTLAEIERKTDIELLAQWTHKIKALGTIHQHLDLIVGLPGEDWASFRRSFNEVFSWQPDMLQMGFLKLLKGSGLRHRAKELGLIGRTRAPYEILATKWLSFEEVYELKQLEDILEKFYNAQLCPHLLGLGIDTYVGDAFNFFHDLTSYLREQGQLVVTNADRLISLLADFLLSRQVGREIVTDCTVWDYAVKELTIPKALQIEKGITTLTSELLSEPSFVQQYLPDLVKLNFKQQLRLVAIFDTQYPQPGRYLYRVGGQLVQVEG